MELPADQADLSKAMTCKQCQRTFANEHFLKKHYARRHHDRPYESDFPSKEDILK